MPEYLAPGVFVEETSFRAKSLEGVGTSTTGFVGPTLRGPVGETPELLTSFGDFERIYGGFDDLGFGVNYLAHSVRGYFNEGGARLYVSRVAVDGSTNAAAVVLANPDASRKAALVARSNGQTGNGQVYLRQVASPATRKTLENAPEGTLVRIGGTSAPAQIKGGVAPFFLTDGSSFQITADSGATATVTFKGAAVTLAATNPLPADPLAIPNADSKLLVTINGGAQQTIDLHVQGTSPPRLPTTRAELRTAINSNLSGATADIDGTGHLTLTTDQKGASASITVAKNDTLGFPDPMKTANGGDAANAANNNVADLSRVSANEVNALVSAAAAQARAALSPDNRLLLTTADAGKSANLSLAAPGGAGAVSALSALGVSSVAAQGTGTGTQAFFVKRGNGFVNLNAGGVPALLDLDNLKAGETDILTVTAVTQDASGNSQTFENLGLDRNSPQWIGRVLALNPANRTDALQNVYALQLGANVTASDLRTALFGNGDEVLFTLTGGTDGLAPTSFAYAEALTQLESLEDIAIVAAPGYSAYDDWHAIENELIIHVEDRKKSRYRIAVLDTPPAQTLSGASAVRSQIDSTRAALYYPWVVTANPLARPSASDIPKELTLPPSGFVCGIYARNDINRGVFKAPANEVVLSALRFESDVNTAQQEVLNPQGVNCLRFFPGRGYRVWGARTASSDPEWKYVNVRRYFNYLEHTIDRGTQWAVFEPNGERLWANVRDTISNFLYNEWVSGALLGGSPKEAFFVRCDRSTMNQYNLDNGQLICLVGVAVLKPAEFVIFRVGQMTADARV